MSKPLVMVVDDEIDVANAVANTIKDIGKYDVLTAYSAQEALDNLQKNKILFGLGGNRINFVFLDIKMPGIDGLGFLKQAREKFGENIGISMLTAWEDEEKWDKATSGYVVNYIRKPFKAEEIVKTLDCFFHGKECEMVLNTFEKHLEKKEEFKKQA